MTNEKKPTPKPKAKGQSESQTNTNHVRRPLVRRGALFSVTAISALTAVAACRYSERKWGFFLMRIETKNVNELTAYDQNSRTHSAAQVAKLEASIREFGMAGTIAKGHGTAAGDQLYPPPGKAAGASIPANRRSTNRQGSDSVNNPPPMSLPHLTPKTSRRCAITFCTEQLAVDD